MDRDSMDMFTCSWEQSLCLAFYMKSCICGHRNASNFWFNQMLCPSTYVQHSVPLYRPSLRHFWLILHVLSFEVHKGSVLIGLIVDTVTGPHSHKKEREQHFALWPLILAERTASCLQSWRQTEREQVDRLKIGDLWRTVDTPAEAAGKTDWKV